MTRDPAQPATGSRQWLEAINAGRHDATVGIVRYFAYDHLPVPLRSVSAACAHLALDMIERLPDGPELTTGLRKLLKAKDCFVRTALDAPDANA
ncbi:hypothetical protein [Polymorphospora lycopeni]|uniref:Uncharacterized protein n=1 Tax=Polymorphospora lycopeni TaxID=3140240 RepID=A0ABV5CKU3_9ACTN